ncbi:hypothetical protein NXC24_PC01975 (plasmid) [Rhizobium sp. NXC24]|nr:hypothetical protein NXC24_PC01975 [Rhizobium sp. NXC24]
MPFVSSVQSALTERTLGSVATTLPIANRAPPDSLLFKHPLRCKPCRDLASASIIPLH